MNKAALQRIDPYIKTIIDSSSQVALYKYKEDEWKRTDISGTLFVYERNSKPFYGFLILNRASPDNWVQPITDGIEIQIQPPFILYKRQDSEINGIWFYEEEGCHEIGETLKKYIAVSEQQSNQQQQSGGPGDRQPGKMDLSSLLNKASNKAKSQEKQLNQKADINLRTTKDSPSSGGEKFLKMFASATNPTSNGNSTAVGSVEVPEIPVVSAPAASSVVEFFAQASQQQQGPPPPQLMGSPGPAPPPGGPPPGIVGPSVVGPGIIPIMHGVPPGMALLPQHPGAPPVLVPLIRPGATGSPGHGPAPPGPVIVTASSGFQPMIHQHPPHPNAIRHPMPETSNAMHSVLSNPGTVSVEALERTQREESRTPPSGKPFQNQNPLENDLKNRLNIGGGKGGRNKSGGSGGGGKSPSAASAQQQQQKRGRGGKGGSPLTKAKAAAELEAEPELLSPMAFTRHAASQPPQQIQTHHPLAATNGNSHGSQPEVTPLTQGQMVQAMQHLLRTDKTFVAKLHQAYVESLNNKLN